MSECKVYRREIVAAADGGLMGSRARAHVTACRACRGELRERESLRALVAGLGKVEAPADFEFRLRARMATAKGDGGRARFAGRWLYGFAPFAVAACFLLVSATLYFWQSARPMPADAPTFATKPARNAEPGRVPTLKAQGSSAAAAMQTSPPAVVSSKTGQSANRSNLRMRQAREVASRGERRADFAKKAAVNSFTSARVLRPLTIAVRSPGGPPRMILRDESGAERVVSVRAVSFGSQDFLARETALRPSGAAETGGVW